MNNIIFKAKHKLNSLQSKYGFDSKFIANNIYAISLLLEGSDSDRIEAIIHLTSLQIDIDKACDLVSDIKKHMTPDELTWCLHTHIIATAAYNKLCLS